MVTDAMEARPVKRSQTPTARTPWAGTTPLDLINAGLIAAPANLVARYRRHQYHAVLRVDGTVEYAGKAYKSPSTAAAHVRLGVMGPRPGRPYPPTNGWQFWRVKKAGHEVFLDDLRQRLYRKRER